MYDNSFLELQNGDIVEVNIENGRWARLVAGCDEKTEWLATLVAPANGQGWTVLTENRDPHYDNRDDAVLGVDENLSYEAAQALAVGYMADRTGRFEFHDGKPYLRHTPRGHHATCAEALPESKMKREVCVAEDAGGQWTATCEVSFWDEEHRHFMMEPLKFVLGRKGGWAREEAERQGLHWLVNGSILNFSGRPTRTP